MATKPAFILAFANDREGSFLRNIAQEHETILQALDEAPVELISIPAAASNRIMEKFGDARDRVAGFHYGGHADGENLLLESVNGGQQVHAGSFADFLGQQKGLRFIFLNGCSTQAQAQKLQETGIDHVIVTNRAIDDEAAKLFAKQFYSSIASGADVPQAFEEASAGVMMQNNGQTRSLYWAEIQNNDVDTTQPPWFLVNHPGIRKLWTINDSDVNTLITEIKKMIGNGKLKQAIEKLEEHLNQEKHELHEDVLALSRKYKKNQRNIRMGIIANSEANMIDNQVTAGILGILADLGEENE